MSLEKIVAISGKPGLYEVISQTKSGVILESLEDKKRFPFSALHKISTLNDIAIYTYSEEVPLPEVFMNIHNQEKGKTAIDPKSDKNTLMSYFEQVLPDFDQERVYPSNIKKVLTWYNTLVEAEFDFNALNETESEEQAEEEKA